MKCKNCKGKVEKNWSRPTKKFCSPECRTRYNARKHYKIVKNNPEYKKMRKKYFKKWLNKNRERFNDLCRDKNKIFQIQKRKENKKGRLCNCGGKLEDIGYLTCRKCRARKR